VSKCSPAARVRVLLPEIARAYNVEVGRRVSATGPGSSSTLAGVKLATTPRLATFGHLDIAIAVG